MYVFLFLEYFYVDRSVGGKAFRFFQNFFLLSLHLLHVIVYCPFCRVVRTAVYCTWYTLLCCTLLNATTAV